MVSGKDIPPLNSKKIDSYCQSIIEVFGRHSVDATEAFKNAIALIADLGEVTNDRLKRQAVLNELLANNAINSDTEKRRFAMLSGSGYGKC